MTRQEQIRKFEDEIIHEILLANPEAHVNPGNVALTLARTMAEMKYEILLLQMNKEDIK